MPGTEPWPGEFWLVDFGQPLGHEQGYRRPALIVSDRRLISFGLAIVCPTTRARLGWPVHVEVESTADTGLAATSYVQTEQIRTVSADRLIRHLGVADLATSTQVHRIITTLLHRPLSQ